MSTNNSYGKLNSVLGGAALAIFSGILYAIWKKLDSIEENQRILRSEIHNVLEHEVKEIDCIREIVERPIVESLRATAQQHVRPKPKYNSDSDSDSEDQEQQNGHKADITALQRHSSVSTTNEMKKQRDSSEQIYVGLGLAQQDRTPQSQNEQKDGKIASGSSSIQNEQKADTTARAGNSI